jgi:hypothetical protein
MGVKALKDQSTQRSQFLLGFLPTLLARADEVIECGGGNGLSFWRDVASMADYGAPKFRRTCRGLPS